MGFAIVVDWVATFVDSTLKVEDIQRRMAQRIKVTLMPKGARSCGQENVVSTVPPSFTRSVNKCKSDAG